MSEWRGFPRTDGSYGTRNHVLVLPSVSCANQVCRRIADSVDGVVAAPHNTGCALCEKAIFTGTLDILAGLGMNPNVHSVLVVGLGCETVSSDELADAISRSGKTVYRLSIQDMGTIETVEKGIGIVKKLVAEASKIKRKATDLSTLVVGVECGGSDWTSGVISNPAVGIASDIIVNGGGTVILGETTEMVGAEHILVSRAINKDVGRRIMEIVRRYEDEAIEVGCDIYGSNPSKGNIEGGLSTIEEKALGAIKKGGSTPVMEVVEYGVKPSKKGLVIMDTPGYDLPSITGMAAGGANIIVFTTGRGSPVGLQIAPTIKVTGNPETFNKMSSDIDVNLGDALVGDEDIIISELGKKVLETILEVASGRGTKSEILGYNELYVWRRGADL